jgi:signal transduction histidine kinase
MIDTGKGIPSDILPKLTDPFVRADTDPYLAEQGWGPGLPIAKSLVDLHEGSLDIESTMGKGTTISVTLPNGAA